MGRRKDALKLFWYAFILITGGTILPLTMNARNFNPIYYYGSIAFRGIGILFALYGIFIFLVPPQKEKEMPESS